MCKRAPVQPTLNLALQLLLLCQQERFFCLKLTQLLVSLLQLPAELFFLLLLVRSMHFGIGFFVAFFAVFLLALLELGQAKAVAVGQGHGVGQPHVVFGETAAHAFGARVAQLEQPPAGRIQGPGHAPDR